MNEYLEQIEIFDWAIFPHGVKYNFAPITLIGGSEDATYLVGALYNLAFNSMWACNNICGFDCHYASIIGHKENGVAILEQTDSEKWYAPHKFSFNGVNYNEDVYSQLTIEIEETRKELDKSIWRENTTILITPWELECRKHPTKIIESFSQRLELAKQWKSHLIIYTNDDLLYNAVRILVKKGELDPSDVSFIYFALDKKLGKDYHGNTIKVDKNGTLSKNPEGLLDTMTKQLLELV